MAIIMLDFDGTMVEFAYPFIGKENPNAVQVVHRLKEKGHKIILNTARVESALNDNKFQEALDWLNNQQNQLGIVKFAHRKIQPIWHFTENGIGKYREHIFIDDMALGIPLHPFTKENSLPLVNWYEIERIFKFINIAIAHFKFNDIKIIISILRWIKFT